MDAEAFIREKLSVSVPWSDLVQQSNLQKILLAIVQRLDRYDRTLVPGGGGGSGSGGGAAGLSVIPSEEIQAYRDRIDVLENVVLQSRVEGLGQVANEAKRRLALSKHVIPLAQLKGKVDTFETTLQATADAVDETNERLGALASTFQKEVELVRGDIKTLEAKHEALAKRVEQIAKDIFEQIQKKIAELQAQMDKISAKVEETDARVSRCYDYVDQVDSKVEAAQRRVLQLEDTMPLKADKSALDQAIQQIRDEIAKLNIEEIMAMARKANERIDLMDVRCDRMEDEASELKKFVHRFVKELEDQQLEKQIESLRRELQEAKSGVLTKANERMDVIQKETEDLKSSLTATQGHVQITRENVQQLEEFVREKIGVGVDVISTMPVPSAVPPGSSKALLAQLQQDVSALQERFAQIAENNNEARQRQALDTIDDIMARLEQLDRSKADRDTLKQALDEKADKELVAKETEANQRAVDEALRTMNAGTQGIQQLLERQEGTVAQLYEKVSAKPDREELERLEEELRRARAAPDPHAALEALYTKYGVNVDEAAGMRRPMTKYNCISCNRPIVPEYRDPVPSLPLLPPTKDRVVPYVPSGARKPVAHASPPGAWSESLVEVRELPNMRTAGGAYTTPRAVVLRRTSGTRSPEAVEQMQALRRDSGSKPVDLVGEDGRIYHGRMRSAGTLRLPPTGGGK